jgi:hypothetical protein
MPLWSKWVLGIVAGLIITASVAGFAAVSGHGERLATVETKQELMERETLRRLDRIDKSLDRLLERDWRTP